MLADFETGLKICCRCRLSKALLEFSLCKSRGDNLFPQCRSCCAIVARRQLVNRAARRRENPAKFAEAYRLEKYGLSVKEGAALRAKQQGMCPGCLNSLSTVREVVDHCHETGKIRGLLCHNCNVALGHIKDQANTLYRLAEYLVNTG